MKVSHTLRYLPAALLTWTAQPTLAVEPLTVQELVAHCAHYADDPESKDGVFCLRYIQGFIDGAVATDERVTVNLSAEYDREETFSERAMRTRSQYRLQQQEPTVSAEFCLGTPVPLEEVVQEVVGDLETRAATDADLPARTAVYRVLRREYPCRADEQS